MKQFPTAIISPRLGTFMPSIRGCCCSITPEILAWTAESMAIRCKSRSIAPSVGVMDTGYPFSVPARPSLLLTQRILVPPPPAGAPPFRMTVNSLGVFMNHPMCRPPKVRRRWVFNHKHGNRRRNRGSRHRKHSVALLRLECPPPSLSGRTDRITTGVLVNSAALPAPITAPHPLLVPPYRSRTTQAGIRPRFNFNYVQIISRTVGVCQYLISRLLAHSSAFP